MISPRPCACGCGRIIPAGRRGRFAVSCYERWQRAGKPASGPPPPMPAAPQLAIARERSTAARLGRLEDYSELRSWGVSVKDAARRTGVTERTAWRYEAVRRAAA